MANNKKRAGGFKNNKIKSSNFLPGVFQTKLNSKWLDSTLDQMISKGNLKDLNNYIGSQDGRYSTALDSYDDDNSYAPGMVTKNIDGSIKHTLTFDDVKTKILSEFNEYNFGSAYASTSYYLRPPVDIDKFVNYNNYYWVEEMPTYTSINENSSTPVNPVSDAQGRLNYTLVDDNETFELEDSMIIYFTGMQWHEDVREKTYIVTGVGQSINLRLYRDRYSNEDVGQGRQVYNFYSPASIKENDFWDHSELVTVSPTDTSNVHPITLLDNYISSPSTPLFDKWYFTNEASNNTLYVHEKLVQFSNAWDWGSILNFSGQELVARAQAEMAKVYLTQIDRHGIHSYKLILDAVAEQNAGKWAVRTFVSPNLTLDDKKWTSRLQGWNSSNYDASVSDVVLKDYHVINKNCFYQTAWSRTNFWVNKQTILNLHNRYGMYFDKDLLLSKERIARRPIIEFDSNMHLFNHVSQRTDDQQQLGHIDFIVPLDSKYTPKENAGGLYYDNAVIPDADDGVDDINPSMTNGNTVVFELKSDTDEKYRKLFRVEKDAGVYKLNAVKTLEVDDVTNARNAPRLSHQYQDADLFYDGSVWRIAQNKTRVNQPPLFHLYDDKGDKIQDLPKSAFEGSKVFGYKVGTGINDTELSFAVAYQDGPKGAEFVFENFLETEVFQAVYRSNFSRNITNRRILNNMVYFKVDNLLKFNYEKSKIPHGAKNSYRYVVENNNQDLTIPYGHSNWRTTKDYYIHEYYGEAVVSELVSPGIVTDKSQSNNVHLLASPQTNINIYDLIPNNTITIRTHEGHDIENLPAGYVSQDINVTRFSNKINIDFGGDTNGLQLYVDYSRAEFINKPYIIVSEDADKVYYELTINGKVLDSNAHTVDADQITVFEKEIKNNDIVVLEFINNKTSTTNGIPQVLEYNSNNEMVDTFTFTETLDHWHSLLRHIPDFQGDIMGNNNYSSSSKLLGAGGGTIFVHEDLSNTHDISFVDKSLNISGALIEQGRDWDGFRTRFINQVRRLYSTKPYTSTYELTNDAINLITINRKGGELYKNSNMAYSDTSLKQKILLQENISDYYINFVTNKDYLIQDHLYVYMSDDYLQDGRLIKRLLTKDVDYTVSGDHIDLITDVVHSPGLDPYIEVVYHDMDSDSYIPPSSVKLGLHMAYVPTRHDERIVCHDGYEYDISSTADLQDLKSTDFDPVAACLFDLERRIHSGLVKNTNYKSIYDYLPAPHRSTWYNTNIIDNYLEKSFKQWYIRTGQTTLTPTDYFDDQTPWNWNYSSVVTALPGYTNLEQLPGHWVGAYTHIFGTATPHTTPWHMLGYSYKPSWWDSRYSWIVQGGDTTKRDALINALKNGYVNLQATNITHARFNWDWNASCPVSTDGTLVFPHQVLGYPSELNRFQPFVFGDWGPIEQEWRNSDQGYMSLVDAIVKLSPAKAWTDLLQPGSLTENENRNARISERTKLFMSPKDYKIPGVVYDNTVKGITFSNKVDGFKISDTFIKLYGIEDTPILNTSINYSQADGYIYNGDIHQFVSSVSLDRRGSGFKVQPTIVSNIPGAAENNTNIEILLEKVPHVSNGILQAQHNFILRNQYDTDLAQIYKSLDTHLIYKVAGFTGKNLLDIKADSSSLGPVTLTDQDYEIVMHKGLASVIPSASKLTITKTNVFYQVDGISNSRQEFLFYEPDLSNHALSKTITFKDLSFRKYDRFANNHSVAEFGTKFKKIQDTYNFIRGYWEYMNVNGYDLQTERDAVALDFIKWTINAGEGDVLHIELGNSISFTPASGAVQEYNTYGYHNNDILTTDNNIFEVKDLGITRQDGSVLIDTKDKANIGGLSSAVINYEHAIVLNNTTSLGVKMYDGTRGNYQRRLLLSGQKTTDWDGNISAPGYLIKNDHIVQNFDSSVEATNDFYRTDITEFNDQITKAKNITIGNVGRDWVDTLGLNSTTVSNFYKGAVKNCGTTNALNRLNRTTLLNHGSTTVNGYEQFMFRHSYMGDTNQLESTEIVLNNSDLKSNPQVIVFDTSTDSNVISIPNDSSKMVNQGNNTFATTSIQESELDLFTAGEVLKDEARYTIESLENISEIFDTSADYTSYETWNDSTSYKLGTIVRHEGRLYQCNVDSTGLNAVSQGVTRTGVNSEPRFTPGTVATIEGISTTLQGVTNVIELPIVVDGSNTVTEVPALSTLTVDGETVTFTESGLIPTVIGEGIADGSLTNPAFPDVTNKQITLDINNGEKSILIDFDTTPNDIIENNVGVNLAPGNITENFTGVDNGVAPAVDLEDTFTISEILSNNGYSVDNIKVNGVVVSGYTVVGQDIVFNAGSEPQDGDAIVVTLVHVPDYKTTFTIQQTLTNLFDIPNIKVFVDNALVPTSNYTLNNQQIIFVTGPVANAQIRFEIPFIPHSLTAEEVQEVISDRLNLEQVTTVTCFRNGNGTLRFVLNDALNVSARFKMLVDTVGNTHTALGFSNGIDLIQQVANIPGAVAVPLQTAVDQINNTASIVNVIASIDQGKLKLTSTNSQMTLSGSTISEFGIASEDLNKNAETNTTITDDTESTAAQQIHDNLIANGIDYLSVGVNLKRIQIIAPTSISIDLGNTSFNTEAGLQTGQQNAATDGAPNVFQNAQWDNISQNDPALFNIWVSNDSAYEVTNIAGIQTKFNSWNVLQVQNHGLFTSTIEAGNETDDGNDAKITSNISNTLNVGDFVLLLNTTTVPNIDGIHKVTKVDSNNTTIFYIDRFIEQDGTCVNILPLRSHRFKDIPDRNEALVNNAWQMPPLSFAWTNTNAQGVRSTNVYQTTPDVQTNQNISLNNANSFWSLVRDQNSRVTNTDIKNAVIYNTKNDQLYAELEVFDPLRGLIPGVADRELDFKNAFDPAIYNNSTDTNYGIDTNDCWTDELIGTRWWDTGKSKYYDYDQGQRRDSNGVIYYDYDYMAQQWGKLYPGSDIEVWEWTKSTVPPDDYADAVISETEMYGQIATGVAFSIVNTSTNEDLFYYTQDEEWNASLGRYVDVYYFWVKDKETISSPNKFLTLQSLKSIMLDPTANGIGWIAAINSNSVIVSNANYFTDDNSTLLQINKNNEDQAHNSWMLISEDIDVIPDYWYIGLRNNYSEFDSKYNRLPANTLHPLNKIGDDRSKKQVWFSDISAARYAGALAINDLLMGVNIWDEKIRSWNKIVQDTDKEDVIRRVPFGDIVWKWANYYSDDYIEELSYSLSLDNSADVPNVDTNLHSYIKVQITDGDQVDRSEYYRYFSDKWNLVRKDNATVEFNADYLSERIGWDVTGWDAVSWDNTKIQDHWITIINGLRNYLFTDKHKDKFNQFFFATVRFALATETKVDWVHKSTYVQLLVDQYVDQSTRVYKKNSINSVIGYFNTVKPFHTKISTILDSYKTPIENANLYINEERKFNITAKYEDFIPVYQGTIYDNNPPQGTDPEVVYDGGSFDLDDTQYSEIQYMGDFLQPENYNQNRLTGIDLRPQELLNITVQTNEDQGTFAASTRTFRLIQDNYGYTTVYSITDNNTTDITTELSESGLSVDITDATNFEAVGYAIIGAELIKYNKDGNTLIIIQRGLNGTFVSAHAVGDNITDVSDTNFYVINERLGFDRVLYENQPYAPNFGGYFNHKGMSILYSDKSLYGKAIQDSGQGLEI